MRLIGEWNTATLIHEARVRFMFKRAKTEEDMDPLHSGLKLVRYSIYLNVAFVAGLFSLGGLQSVLPDLASVLMGVYVFAMVCGFLRIPRHVDTDSTGNWTAIPRVTGHVNRAASGV